MSSVSETPTSPLRVLIVEHEEAVDPALVGERLALAHADVTVVGPHLPNPVPASLSNYDAFVVLGGSMGPLEDEKAPWLPGVRSLLAEALETNVPTLGICLGAQLLATVAGGRVAEIDAGPEVGLIAIELTDAGRNDPLLGVLTEPGADGSPARTESPLRALQWHWLEAKTLPAGSVPLFTSQACSNQAFRVGERAWGLQFHLEALTKAARLWSDESTKELDELQIDAETEIINVVTEAEPELRATWSRVIDRWIELAVEHRNANP